MKRAGAALIVLAAVLLVVLLVAPAPGAVAAGRPGVRAPAVAGQFYPQDAARLRAAIDGFLADALPARGERPIALVVPHAGYIFSGQIAADAYRQAMGRGYDLIVLLGTNHSAPGLEGVAVYAGGGFRTPLGVAGVDERAAADLLAADRGFTDDAGAHAREHSIEVQVPFLQVAFPGAKILPALVGTEDPGTCARLGKALARVLAGRRSLVVASSDLAHYPAYDDAVVSDRAVLAAMARVDAARLRAAIAEQLRAGRAGLSTCACGEAPVLVALETARALGATRGVVVSYANSGDTPLGDRERVVGYGAVAFDAGPQGADASALGGNAAGASAGRAVAPLGREDKAWLLQFARRTIERYLASETAPLARGYPPSLHRTQGAFVTLLAESRLRGCIGSFAEDVPLAQVVGAMALQAAFNDRRFKPLVASEFPGVEIEISVLSPLCRLPGPESIVLGVDGVQIRKGGRTAVYLPQVAVEQGWNRQELLEHLCDKAGLPRSAWKSGAEFWTFRTMLFRESEFGTHGSTP